MCNFDQALERSHRSGVRIAFVNKLSFNEPLGIGYVSAYLKVYFPDINIEFFNVGSRTVRDLQLFDPTLIFFSVMTGEHGEQISYNRHLKNNLLPYLSVFGGPHPTYFPSVIDECGVDIICRGEGEVPVRNLITAILAKSDIRQIGGLWVKYGDMVCRNPVDSLVPDLDVLPFPDRDLYYGKSRFLREYGRKPVLGARGCPFRCSYCYNSGLNKIFKDKGEVLRSRSPESVVREVSLLRKNYGVPFVAFIEDVFSGTRLEWLKEFNQLYAPVSVPFFISIRAEFVTPQIAEYLKRSGCVSASMAVEHGDYEYRKKFLFRGMTDEMLIEGTRVLEAAGIRVASPVILGMPFSDFQGDLKTLKLVCKSRPTHATTAIFQPYPGTALTEMCLEKKLIDVSDVDQLPENFFLSANLKDVDYGNVIKLHNSFSVLVLLHRWFKSDVEKLFYRLPDNIVIRLLNVVLKYMTFKKIIGYRRGFRELVREVYHGWVSGVFDVGIKWRGRSKWLQKDDNGTPD